MTIVSLDPVANASPQALLAFLTECRDGAAQLGRPRLVSITVEVDNLDPLAVLESIFEPRQTHFYAERPSEGWAIAAAESVLSFSASGAERFAECQRFIDTTLEDTIVVGNQELPFAGPHFLSAFTFLDTVGGDEPFEAARHNIGSESIKTGAAFVIGEFAALNLTDTLQHALANAFGLYGGVVG